MATLPSYVLITPARNEAEFIDLTLQSVVSQTALPLRWVIVSDGSTDGMDDIVARYTEKHPWIQLVQMPPRAERHFAGKVLAFNAGYAKVADLPYEIIGNLDADVSFASDYFEFLLQRFAENPRLGVGGTPFTEGSDSPQYDYRFTSIEHVSGQCQIFRRRCFEEIGGYQPRKIGGIDLVAVITARMKGWQTRTFVEKTYKHHRVMGTAVQGGLSVPLKGGRKDYVLGCHPAWEFFRCVYQMSKPPIVVGGILRFVGFGWAMISGVPIEIPGEVVRFRRQEQMSRLRRFFVRS